jgi:preprotein translocase subunit Sss1
LHLLRKYCLGERNFRFKKVKNDISVRYPNGSKQLTQKIFSKVKRAVYDRVRRAKAKPCVTEYLTLLKIVGLELDVDGCVIDTSDRER